MLFNFEARLLPPVIVVLVQDRRVVDIPPLLEVYHELSALGAADVTVLPFRATANVVRLEVCMSVQRVASQAERLQALRLNHALSFDDGFE
mmetsp:Transcript_84469/g.242545  ORF Transcript_84469/g.242545 Transcript_84469/m.242545 type:complete len:91 (-) Transcript_84469:25-297(-)